MVFLIPNNQIPNYFIWGTERKHIDNSKPNISSVL